MVRPLVKTLASNAVEAPFVPPTLSVQPRHPHHGFVAKRRMDQAPEVIVLARIITACGFGFSLFCVGANVIAVALSIIVTGIIRVPLRKESTYTLVVGIFP